MLFCHAAECQYTSYRTLLVSGRYVLVNIILDMSLAYGLTITQRANTIIDTVTYLVLHLA